MMLSRGTKKNRAHDRLPRRQPAENKAPSLPELIKARDYIGVITLLQFYRQVGQEDESTLPWLGYCAFHVGDYKQAVDHYLELLGSVHAGERRPDPSAHNHLACCYFYLGMFAEAAEAAGNGAEDELQRRLKFHLAYKFNDETQLTALIDELSSDSTHDQLSLAAMHYLRNHFQEATDIYKRLLLENREYLALNVYVALCYYKLDYYEVSLEILGVYLQNNPASAIAINLKACNNFRLYNGKAAEEELKVLQEATSSTYTYDNDLVRHNLVVFRDGENALQVLPPLLDAIPEARLNLVIFHLRSGDMDAAHELIKDVEPNTPQEYILKGVCNAAIGQERNSKEHLKMAEQYFQLVGASASECDTIPGRQCMASCFFLLRQFDDVLIYLRSIKTYFSGEDSFNCNFGVALASVHEWEEAEEALLLVQDEAMRSEYTYLSWLARVHIMNLKSELAWDLYLRMETGNESFSLLQLIANDCYATGAFYIAAKAFDVLERLDPNPEFWEGKRGACVGVLQAVIAGKGNHENLRDVMQMLRNTSNPQVEYIIRITKKWCAQAGLGHILDEGEPGGDESPLEDSYDNY